MASVGRSLRRGIALRDLRLAELELRLIELAHLPPQPDELRAKLDDTGGRGLAERRRQLVLLLVPAQLHHKIVDAEVRATHDQTGVDDGVVGRPAYAG